MFFTYINVLQKRGKSNEKLWLLQSSDKNVKLALILQQLYEFYRFCCQI